MFSCSSSAPVLQSLHWYCCCSFAGIVTIIPALALPPSLHWHCVHCHASIVVALASMPLSHWCGHRCCSCNGITLAFLPPSCLLWLVVASLLVALFSLHRCLLTCSLRLLTTICLSFSPDGCCVTSCCVAFTSCCLSLHRHLSSMRLLVVVLPLVMLPLPCISSPHATTSPNTPAGCCIASHHAALLFA